MRSRACQARCFESFLALAQPLQSTSGALHREQAQALGRLNALNAGLPVRGGKGKCSAVPRIEHCAPPAAGGGGRGPEGSTASRTRAPPRSRRRGSRRSGARQATLACAAEADALRQGGGARDKSSTSYGYTGGWSGKKGAGFLWRHLGSVLAPPLGAYRLIDSKVYGKAGADA